MSLIVVTPPAEEPVSLSEAVLHLRVDGADDDALITALITAARQHVEDITRRSLVTQTLELRLDAFEDLIELPRPPVQSVSSVKYVDDDGALQTLDPLLYLADIYSQPGRLMPAYNESWPDTRVQANAVTVRYVAGYGAASAVPMLIKRAMLLIIGHLYEHREAVLVGVQASELPMAVDRLVAPYRVHTF